MKELLEAMKKYESKNNDVIRITFYSDGSGHCDGKRSLRLFIFGNTEGLLKILEL